VPSPTVDISVKRFGPQLQILEHGRAVAIALTAQDGTSHRLIATTSLLGDLIAYLSRARARAVERLNASGHQRPITTALETGTMIDPKSLTLAMAPDASHALLQVTDSDGHTLSIRMKNDLVAGLANQMARLASDMANRPEQALPRS